MRHRLPTVAVAVAVLAIGCGHDFEPPDRAERLQEAETLFSAAIFDSIVWDDEQARGLAGNDVYSAECRRCHGQLGRGQTDYASERGLEVPSLVEPDWALASLDSLRHTIYVGHGEGMPGYGVAGITPREIDASAFYVLFQLRQEVLGGS